MEEQLQKQGAKPGDQLKFVIVCLIFYNLVIIT
ncbi:hypothetical protein ACEW7V_03250 [Areca yellow leaf disease phytoplasma]